MTADALTAASISASVARHAPHLLAKLREETTTHVCEGVQFCINGLLIALLDGTCTEEQRQAAALSLYKLVQLHRLGQKVASALVEVAEAVEVEQEQAGGGKGKVGHA